VFSEESKDSLISMSIEEVKSEKKRTVVTPA
jgi:hypothetical protein